MCDPSETRSSYACPVCHRALMLLESAVACDNDECESLAAGYAQEAPCERDSYLMLRGAANFELTTKSETKPKGQNEQ